MLKVKASTNPTINLISAIEHNEDVLYDRLELIEEIDVELESLRIHNFLKETSNDIKNTIILLESIIDRMPS